MQEIQKNQSRNMPNFNYCFVLKWIDRWAGKQAASLHTQVPDLKKFYGSQKSVLWKLRSLKYFTLHIAKADLVHPAVD